MVTRPTYLQFMCERLGANYVVVGRRTAQPKFDRRGIEQQQVTHGEYKAAEREYRTLYGDPYDDVRAEMYRLLTEARDRIGSGELVDRINGALAAEIARP